MNRLSIAFFETKSIICILRLTVFPVFIVFLLSSPPSAAQTAGEKQFWEKLGFSREEKGLLEKGQAVVREHPTADKAEIIIYGAVFIKAAPEAFVKSYTEISRRVNGTSYLSAGLFKQNPTLADLDGLTFDREDIAELKDCVPGECEVQLPVNAMATFRKNIDWKAPDAEQKATVLARKMVLEALQAYRTGGNRELGYYHDHERPTQVEAAYKTILSRADALPRVEPELYQYLLEYPRSKPKSEIYEFYYWENVKFGLKPTFRMNHVLVYKPKSKPASSWIIADKQLYSSHYFQTALDLWFCVFDVGKTASGSGFYLLNLKGSRQDGLTGFKGRMLRPIVVSKTKSAVEAALLRLRENAEKYPRSKAGD